MNAMRLVFLITTAILLAGSAGVQKTGAADENLTSTGRPATVPVSDQPSGYVDVPPPTEKALHYYHSGNVLWLINTAWGILIPCLFLFTEFSARIRTWAQRIGRKWFLTVGLYFLILWTLVYFIDWPLQYYEGFV